MASSTVLLLVLVTLVVGDDQAEETMARINQTVSQLDTFSKSMEQRYRAVGLIDDFSNIVGKMIESLRQVQDRGQRMVGKIKVQEDRLAKVAEELAEKEKAMKAIDTKRKTLEAEVTQLESRRGKVQEELAGLEERKGRMSREVKSLVEVVDSRREHKEEELARMEGELEEYRGQVERASIHLR